MPNRKTKNIHTHVPSHIGFGIVALVALVFGIILLTQYNMSNQTQTDQSDAAGVRTSTKTCIARNNAGACAEYQTITTSYNTSSPCIAENVALHKCSFYAGQTTTVVDTPAGTSTVAKPKTKPAASTTNPNNSQSASCTSIGGTCKSTGSTGGTYHPGLCPGPNSWQCFVPSTNKNTSTGVVVANPVIETNYLACHNGRVVSVGGAAANNSSSTLTQVCNFLQTGVVVNGVPYNCAHLPQADRNLGTNVCP